MEKLSSYPFRKKVIWGAGHNIHDKREIYSFPSFIKNFDLVGIRDHNQLESWVPCPSCLHTAFDRDYQIDHNFIVYEHKDHPLNINKAPRRNNRSRDIESVISFLGSGETIITNTYHGVYWGTLLNRKVIIIDPFSSKFYGFKHPHPISTLSGWKHVNNTVYYPTALEECRTANLKFNSSVKDFFEKS
jgi:hypothetical protein